MNKFLSVFSLCSRISLPVRDFAVDASRLDFYLPIVGVFPAILVFAAANLFFALTGDAGIASLLALAVQYLAFNLFHLDGLLDTADAFLGCNGAEKTKLILKDSRMGVYGFFAGIASLALKAELLTILIPFSLSHPEFIFCYPVFGRFCAAILPCIDKPARESGLGALAKDSKLRYAVSGFVLALVLWFAVLAAYYTTLYWAAGARYMLEHSFIPRLLALFAAAVIAMFLIALFLKHVHKRIGGYTGDALGASIELGELVFLLALEILLQF